MAKNKIIRRVVSVPLIFIPVAIAFVYFIGKLAATPKMQL